MSLQGITAAQKAEAEQRQHECSQEAIVAATKSGAVALAIASGLGYLLNKYNHAFRTRFTVGAKACFVVMPAFYAFYLESERALWRCSSRQGNQFMSPINKALEQDAKR